MTAIPNEGVVCRGVQNIRLTRPTHTRLARPVRAIKLGGLGWVGQTPVDAHFLNPCPKAHTEESPMKSKAQKPTKKTEEQERSKKRSARERDLQQNTNLPHNIVLWQNGFDRQRQIGPKTLLIQSTLFGPQRPKFFCIKGQA